MPLLPSPPFSSLCSKTERAFYDYIANNQVALPKAAIFTGHDSDEKVCPRVEISAHGGPEEPRATGNFFIQVMITVVGSVDANVTRATFTGLNPGTSYHWYVRACNTVGCSGWFGPVGKTPNGEDPIPSVTPPGLVAPPPSVVSRNRPLAAAVGLR